MVHFVSDGKTDNSAAFACHLVPGATVVLKRGVYLTGPITIPSNVHLVLEKGAVIKFIPSPELYTPVYTRWEGVKCYAMHPLVFIDHATQVKITGEGTIDGSGAFWWQYVKERKQKGGAPESEIEKRLAALNPGYLDQPSGGGGRSFQFLRPPLVQIYHSSDVLMEGITVINSPFWTIHPLFSSHLVFRRLHVKNPYEAPNTDGIDIESCTDVLVLDSEVDVGDDGICLKSGSGPDGIADNVPTSFVEIRGCCVRSAHGGAVIGSETAAGIHHVRVSDCLFDGTDRGIRIKSRRGRGGAISNLEFFRIRMVNNLCPFVVNMFYRCGSTDPSLFSLEKRAVSDETPSLKDVVISDCVATGSKASAAMIVGLPEKPVENLAIRNCRFSVDSDSTCSVNDSDMYLGLPSPEGRGIRLRYVKNLSLDNVTVDGVGKPVLLEEGTSLSQ